MTSDALVSSQPSVIQATEATMKMMKPATVTRAFRLTGKGYGQTEGSGPLSQPQTVEYASSSIPLPS